VFRGEIEVHRRERTTGTASVGCRC
jgi:hypothetical protein